MEKCNWLARVLYYHVWEFRQKRNVYLMKPPSIVSFLMLDVGEISNDLE
jgi:hypothetical protein